MQKVSAENARKLVSLSSDKLKKQELIDAMSNIFNYASDGLSEINLRLRFNETIQELRDLGYQISSSSEFLYTISW